MNDQILKITDDVLKEKFKRYEKVWTDFNQFFTTPELKLQLEKKADIEMIHMLNS